MNSGNKDVKSLAAMFEKRNTVAFKPKEKESVSAQGQDKPKVGKLQISSIFGSKKAADPPKKAEPVASSQSSKDAGTLKNTFEPKKLQNTFEPKKMANTFEPKKIATNTA